TRRWIAAWVYPILERHVPEPSRDAASAGELRAVIDAMLTARSRVRHPMSIHMFSGAPTRAEIALFLEHHWLRSCRFHQLVVEFAQRRDDVGEPAILYGNLYDETGSGAPPRAHPPLLQRLKVHLGLPSSCGERAVMPEERVYLNNRIR